MRLNLQLKLFPNVQVVEAVAFSAMMTHTRVYRVYQEQTPAWCVVGRGLAALKQHTGSGSQKFLEDNLTRVWRRHLYHHQHHHYGHTSTPPPTTVRYPPRPLLQSPDYLLLDIFFAQRRRDELQGQLEADLETFFFAKTTELYLCHTFPTTNSPTWPNKWSWGEPWRVNITAGS